MPSQYFGPPPITPFDMRHMANTLPDYSQPPYNQAQQMHQFTQAPTLDPSYAYSSPPNHQFASQIAGQYMQQFPQNMSSQSRSFSGYNTSMGGTTADLQTRGQMYTPQQHFSYNNSMPQQPQYTNFQGHQPSPYSLMPASSYQHRVGAHYQMPRLQVESAQGTYGMQMYSQSPQGKKFAKQFTFQRSNSEQVLRRNSSNSSLQTSSSTLRGPPRKPRQSGHALWVGNLPPGTQIMDLKDHFAREATEDIESVFLISKSNCAFVNYKTEESCVAAMTRFHDSRFRGARLVCRLRRGSNSGVSPASATTTQPEQKAIQDGSTDGDIPVTSHDQPESSTAASAIVSTLPMEKIAKEKFFIIKSLTLEDLERSVNSGIWATQGHNEQNLNLAFRVSDQGHIMKPTNIITDC